MNRSSNNPPVSLLLHRCHFSLTLLFAICISGTAGAQDSAPAATTPPASATPSTTPSAPVAPAIDDSTNELDATVVTSAPTEAKPVQTVRPATATRPTEVEVYDTIEPEVILGGPTETYNLPGSGYFVTNQEIREQNYTNVNRVLAKVPGVYVREEDGSGLFPNISIRGVDGTRSEKITLMEDGILQAPAPYSSPAAYYSPNVARMAGVEILKGSGQIAFGPNTTGGVINFLSTPIPDQEQFYLRTTYGSNATANIHSHYGDTIETEAGTFGYVAEIFYKRSDGFRTIEEGLGIPQSDRTGYEYIEPMIKLSWEPNTYLDQKFEFKYGQTDADADESYLGQTDADFNAAPYRRYAGSFLDNITTDQDRAYLKYSVSPTNDLDLRIAGYHNEFARDWFKLRAVNGAALHTTLGPTGNANNLAVLRGDLAGTLNYRHNLRFYEAYGAQFSGDYRFETGEIDHTLTFGVREHRDHIQYFEENTNVVTDPGGSPPTINNFGPGSAGNRREMAEATAVWIKDDIEIGKLTVTPGIRHENVDQSFVNFQSNAAFIETGRGYGVTDWTVAGIGFNYELSEENSVFTGIHQGVAIPAPREAIVDGTLPEESLSYELGARHRSGNLNAELVGFITDFENIISTSAGLGLGGGGAENAGTASVKGIEALVSYDPFQGGSLRMPLFFSATWTDATLDEALIAGGGENIYGDGAGGPGIAGADLPYIPEWKLATGVSLETDQWGVDLTASYISDTFGTALNSPVPVNSSRQGIIDGGIVVDVGAHHRLSETTKFIYGVHNLFEEVMISSRIPEGPRANAPREFYVGFEMLWEPGTKPSGGKSVIAK